MMVCDFCLQKIESNVSMPKIRIHTKYVCKAWQEVEVDMCKDCLEELQEKIKQIEAEFYQNKKTLLE